MDKVLRGLPEGPRYSVEIRNPEFLHPEYFAALRAHGAAHVLNAWTRMPELHRQIAMPEAHTADFFVTRALLRYGRTYETAVKTFEPYDRIQDPYPQSHDALRSLIQSSTARVAIALLPIPANVWLIAIVLRSLRRLDEFLNNHRLKAVGLAGD